MKFSLGENVEEDSSIFISDGSLSSEMLTDSDDLLTQLSCDLGLSDFMDQDENSILTDSPSYERGAGCNNLYQQFFSPDEHDEHALFNELLPEGMTATNQQQSSSSSSEASFSLKMEDSSESGHCASVSPGNSFPPSPSGSDSSSSDSNNCTSQYFLRRHSQEIVTLDERSTTNGSSTQMSNHIDTTTPPVSPLSVTLSPSKVTFSPANVTLTPAIVTSPNIINIRNISTIQCVTLPQAAVTVQTAPMSTNSTISVKVPIPKITKPAPITALKTAPLILTSQQLAQLTQSGMLKMTTTSSGTTARVLSSPQQQQQQQQQQPPQMAPIVIKTEPNCSPLSTGMPTVQTIPMTSHTRYAVHMRSSSTDNDVKCLKRQQRMIKNRESACLSRRKKKEYVTSLEEQLNDMAKENAQLKQENEQLKTRLSELESEKSLWAGSGLLKSSNVRKGTALFALLLVVSLNVGPLSGIYMNQSQVPLRKHPHGVSPNFNPVHSEAHIGRSLLWAETEAEHNINNKSSNTTMCPMYFNQTESLRLDNQLRGWFKLDPIVAASNGSLVSNNFEDVSNELRPELAAAKSRKPLRRKRDSRDNIFGTGRNMIRAVDHYVKPEVDSGKTGNIYHMLISEPEVGKRKVGKYGISKQGELTLYETDTQRFTLESFFEAINRREDTFYVVSFSGDHLLLPATSRNESVRPRMSLFLPSLTVSVNDSMKPPANHISMMQIDCEVINTSLVHISEDAIPTHLNARMRSETRRASPTASASHAASNSSLQHNESFGNYEPADMSLNNFEKSNNVTRFKNGTLDTNGLGDFEETEGFVGEREVYSSKFKSKSQWAGPANSRSSSKSQFRRNKKLIIPQE